MPFRSFYCEYCRKYHERYLRLHLFSKYANLLHSTHPLYLQ